MPEIEEVLTYLKGLWLIVLRPAEGIRYLDFSVRGLARSFWAVVYCLPPMLLSWASFRMAWLADQPQGTSTGSDFFFKLAAIELTTWVLPMLGMAAVLLAAGYASRIVPVLVAYNWMMVLFNWLMTINSFLSILAPDDVSAFYLINLGLALSIITFESFVLSVLVSQNRLLVGALMLTNVVLTFYVSWKLQTFFGLG